MISPMINAFDDQQSDHKNSKNKPFQSINYKELYRTMKSRALNLDMNVNSRGFDDGNKTIPTMEFRNNYEMPFDTSNSLYSFYLNTNIPTIGNETSLNCNDTSNPCTKGSQILNYVYENLAWDTNIINIYVIGNLTDCFIGTIRKNALDLLNIRLIGQNPAQYSYLNCRMDLTFTNIYFQYFNIHNKYAVRITNSVGFENCNIEHGSKIVSGKLILKQIRAKYSTFESNSIFHIDEIEMIGCDLRISFEDIYSWQNRTYIISVLNNSVIIDSTISLTRFAMVAFENTIFTRSEVIAIYISAFEIYNCTVSETKRWLLLKGTITLSLQRSVIRECDFDKSIRGIIDSVLSNYMFINECQFLNNGNRAIYVGETGFLYVVRSVFNNNIGGIEVGSIVDLGEMLTGVHITASQFIGNLASRGAAIVLPGSRSIEIYKCEFYRNSAQLGGAIYATSGELSFIQNTFERNEAYSIGCSLCGRGGAIFFDQPNEITIDSSNSFRYYKATNGGGVYIHSSGIFNPKRFKLRLNCVDSNSVSFYGSCFYSHQENLQHDYVTVVGDDSNTLGSSKLKLVTANPKFLKMYPGERVPFEMKIIDGFNNTLQRMEFQPNFFSLDPGVAFQQRVENTTLFLSCQISNDSISKNTMVGASFILNINNPELINITVEILPCPSGFSLMNYSASSTSKKICLKDADPPLQIIIPAVLSGVVLFIVGIVLGILLIYLGWNITEKLKRLKKKERAEEKLQQRLIDKQVVFEDAEMNSSTDLKTSLLGSYYAANNSQGSSTSASSSGKNKKISKKIRLQTEQNYLIPIENIEIVKKLAEGANGIVYLAKWLGTEVAMKSLKLEYITEEENEEFEKEAALLKSLKHPNIVTSYGVCVSGNLKYMVVEYMSRGSLDRAIYSSKTGTDIITLKQKLNILLGVANGMNYLHSLKPYSIIHRDLKPGNILLDKNLSSKVTDFGLSKIIGGNSTSTMTTALGTLFYMSPEILGDESLTQFSTKLDVYSFAIIMYELLFEEPPYLNHKSPKICRFIKPNANLENSSIFNVQAKVVKGLRPTIPFSSKEEQEIWIEEFVLTREPELGVQIASNVFSLFVDLMIECWSGRDTERPDFGEISERLSEMLKTLK